MSREKRFILAAIRASKKTNPNCTFSIGAVVAIGNRIIASAACTTKTHPKNPKSLKKTRRNQLCAETLALFRASHLIDKKDFGRCTLFVARLRKNGSTSMAMPCEFCRDIMRQFGVRDVYYTNREGEIEYLRVS